MPLSEQEQRLLEEMERSLYQNDADFVGGVDPNRGKANYRAIVIAALVGVVGVAVMVTGVVVRQPLIGVLGFAIMFAAVLLIVAPPRRLSRPNSASSTPPSGAKPGSSSFMTNMNDRWEKRQDGRQ